MQDIPFLDAHTHVQFPAYDADREAVLRRAREAGVKMINVGTQISTSRAAIELAEQNPGDLWATVGFHPAHVASEWFHDQNEQSSPEPELFDVAVLKELAKRPKVVAIGECGLDHFRIGDASKEKTKERQRTIFEAQIRLAKELQKPLMIHCRSAFRDLIEVLAAQSLPEIPGIIHFFTGTPEEARRLIDLGFAFTFGGVITFVRDYDAVIKTLPLDRILSETDAPYVAPAPYRGKRNEPAYVAEAVKRLAALKEVSTETMKERIWENAKSIFPDLLSDQKRTLKAS